MNLYLNGDDIPDLAAAEYYIQAWAEGRLVQYYNGKDNFEESDLLAVGDSVTISNIDFKMVKAGSISGTIRDENGNPIFGVTVLVECAFDSMNADGCDWREGSYGKAMSDENGNYLVEGLLGGEYFVRAEFWSQWGVIYEWYDNKTAPFNADRVTVVRRAGGQQRHGALDAPAQLR